MCLVVACGRKPITSRSLVQFGDFERNADFVSSETLWVIPCQITQWLKRYPPPPDFDENLHIWSIWSEKKICQIIAYIYDLLKQPKLARPPHKKPATTPKIQDIDE